MLRIFWLDIMAFLKPLHHAFCSPGRGHALLNSGIFVHNADLSLQRDSCGLLKPHLPLDLCQMTPLSFEGPPFSTRVDPPLEPLHMRAILW